MVIQRDINSAQIHTGAVKQAVSHPVLIFKIDEAKYAFESHGCNEVSASDQGLHMDVGPKGEANKAKVVALAKGCLPPEGAWENIVSTDLTVGNAYDAFVERLFDAVNQEPELAALGEAVNFVPDGDA